MYFRPYGLWRIEYIKYVIAHKLLWFITIKKKCNILTSVDIDFYNCLNCNLFFSYLQKLHLRDQTFMQSWHTFFWAARFVISWLENFKAIVWSDQKFFDSLIKNMQWRAKSAKIEPFSEIFWVPHTQKNSQKGVICNLIFRRCSLYPKINANQHFRSTPSQNLFYIFGGRRSTVC